MKTPVRELYEDAVYKVWKSYNDEVIQIYQQYSDAYELGRVEKDDATFQHKNICLVKAWEKRDQNLRELWTRYAATGDNGPELKATIIRAVRVAPCVYIPQTEFGSYMTSNIKTRNPHACYIEIERVLQSSGLRCFKIHDGFLVLASDDEIIKSALFTVSPLDVVKSY